MWSSQYYIFKWKLFSETNDLKTQKFENFDGFMQNSGKIHFWPMVKVVQVTKLKKYKFWNAKVVIR